MASGASARTTGSAEVFCSHIKTSRPRAAALPNPATAVRRPAHGKALLLADGEEEVRVTVGFEPVEQLLGVPFPKARDQRPQPGNRETVLASGTAT